jgi:hypothetical protein
VPTVTNRWFMLLLLFFSRTAMGLQFQTVASVRPFLMDTLAIDFTAISPSAPALFAAVMMLLCLLSLASFNAAKRIKIA